MCVLSLYFILRFRDVPLVIVSLRYDFNYCLYCKIHSLVISLIPLSKNITIFQLRYYFGNNIF